MKKSIKFSFIRQHSSLAEVLQDHSLASLGDTYVNFAFSLALSNRRRKPLGAKVKGSVLAEALKNAGLREYLPARMTRHMLADAAEALVVYVWLHSHIALEECVKILETDDSVEGFSQLLKTIRDRVKFS